MDLCLVSWNVHGWIGRDGARRPDHGVEAIRSFDADVVALQEVAGRDWEAAARAAGYDALFGSTVGEGYGNAILSRIPVAAVRRLDLSVPGREPRGALDLVLEAAGGPLRVVATHLGLRASERRRQAAQLARHVEAGERDLPLILLGDLNDWTPWGSQLRPIARAIGPLSRVATFPSRRPVLPLDRAACRVPGRIASVRAIQDPSVRGASDHLPLRVSLAPPP